jgi:hypothetical protein
MQWMQILESYQNISVIFLINIILHKEYCKEFA